MNHGPLKGITVIEFAGIGPAPCAGMMLADLGADVLIIDRAQATRSPAGTAIESTQHDIVNRGKRSLTLDLKNPDAVAIALQLITEADVVIEGFRPGVMERLGLGPEVCMANNSRHTFGRKRR